MKMVNGYNRPKEKAEIVDAINDIVTYDCKCSNCKNEIFPFQIVCNHCFTHIIWIVENGDPIICQIKK